MSPGELEACVSAIGRVMQAQLAQSGAEYILVMTGPPDPGSASKQWHVASASNMNPREAIRCLEAGLAKLRQRQN